MNLWFLINFVVFELNPFYFFLSTELPLTLWVIDASENEEFELRDF